MVWGWLCCYLVCVTPDADRFFRSLTSKDQAVEVAPPVVKGKAAICFELQRRQHRSEVFYEFSNFYPCPFAGFSLNTEVSPIIPNWIH